MSLKNNPKESITESKAMTAIIAIDAAKKDAEHLLNPFEEGLLERAVAVLTEVVRVERGEL